MNDSDRPDFRRGGLFLSPKMRKPRCAFFFSLALSCSGCAPKQVHVDHPVIPPASKIIVSGFRKSVNGPITYDGDLAASVEGAILRMQNSQFHIVDRSNIRLIQNEQFFSQLGSVDSSQAVSLGKMSGAQYLLVITLTVYSNGHEITERLTDLTTGEVANVAQCLKCSVDALTSSLMHSPRPYAVCEMNYVKYAWKAWFRMPLGLQIASLFMGGPFFGEAIVIPVSLFQPTITISTNSPNKVMAQVADEECPRLETPKAGPHS